MTRKMLTALICFALTAAMVPAQRTWIVDPNGTGNFTDLLPAIQAAASGDSLLLRGGGHYGGSISFNKHLSLIGVPPHRPMIYDIWLHSPIGTSLTATGVDIQTLFTTAPTSLEDVHLDECTIARTHALLNRCTLGRPNPVTSGSVLYANDSDVVITSSTLYGSAAWSIITRTCNVFPGSAPVIVGGGSVAIADSTLVGAPAQVVTCPPPTGPVLAPASPALVDLGTPVTVSISQSTLTAGASQSVVTSVGTTVYHDTQSQFSPAFTGTPAFLPATLADGAQPGGTITCRFQTEPGYPGALAASLGTAPPTSLPAILGDAWLNPNAFVILVIGVADGSGQLPAAISLPPSAPRGLPITIQGAVAPPNGGLIAATPVVAHVR